jgi:uncharacterized protein (DUF2235 family)
MASAPRLSAPVALLGGAFGYGLKRNVLHLYEFLCQNWEKDDEIYIFGFSRGAFTGRVLAGLIAKMGVLVNCDPRKLHSRTRSLYREFRFARYQSSRHQAASCAGSAFNGRPHKRGH